MKSRSRLFQLAALLIVLALFIPGHAGCLRRENKRFALCMSHLSNDFTNTLANAARQAAQVRGIDLVVLDAEQSVIRQAGQIENLTLDGVAGIIIEHAASDGLNDVLAKCQDKDIPVVIVTQRISDSSLCDCFVGTDAIESGRLEMAACLEEIGNAGNIALLLGPVGAQAVADRYQGYQEALDNHAQVQIIAELNADWNYRKAQSIIANWLSAGKKMDAIVAMNDEMALGAARALHEANMIGKVKVFGIDASPQAILAVKNHEISATVSQQTIEQGSRAVDACIDLANGQKIAAEVLVDQYVVSS